MAMEVSKSSFEYLEWFDPGCWKTSFMSGGVKSVGWSTTTVTFVAWKISAWLKLGSAGPVRWEALKAMVAVLDRSLE
jgi:hypothetical protein